MVFTDLAAVAARLEGKAASEAVSVAARGAVEITEAGRRFDSRAR